MPFPVPNRRRVAALVATLVAVAAGLLATVVFDAGGASGQAVARAAPTVQTRGADHVHVDSASVHGVVNPRGESTSYRFQYGRERPYSNSTAISDAGSEAAFVPVHAPLTGLKPGAVYHYRLVATNASGQAFGEDRTFTVLDPRLRGRFKMRLRVVDGGRPFGHGGDLLRRDYRFNPRCAARCGSVRLDRKALHGNFKSTLNRRGAGVYRGTERFGGGRCDNGLRFRSRASISVRVTATSGDRAQRVKGSLRVRARGCVSGGQRSNFTGSRRAGG
jgi:hypothetical protein